MNSYFETSLIFFLIYARIESQLFFKSQDVCEFLNGKSGATWQYINFLELLLKQDKSKKNQKVVIN